MGFGLSLLVEVIGGIVTALVLGLGAAVFTASQRVRNHDGSIDDLYEATADGSATATGTSASRSTSSPSRPLTEDSSAAARCPRAARRSSARPCTTTATRSPPSAAATESYTGQRGRPRSWCADNDRNRCVVELTDAERAILASCGGITWTRLTRRGQSWTRRARNWSPTYAASRIRATQPDTHRAPADTRPTLTVCLSARTCCKR